MKKLLVLTLLLVLGNDMIFPAQARETDTAVLKDFAHHQARKHKHTKHSKKKKTQKIQQVPLAKIRNCRQQRFWVAPNRIREAKICEVIR
jgi:extradiol dioxygenase family protein